MTKEKKVFESLSNAQEPFESKRGTEFKCSFSGFSAKDAEVRKVNDNYVVSTFTNISGSIDLINKSLGTDFVEDEEYKNVPANISWFVNTEEEANAIASRLKANSRIQGQVVVGTHEYNDDLYLDLRIDTPYVSEGNKNKNAPNRKSKVVEDDDLPI